MKLHTFLIVGFALSVTACTDGDRPAPEQADEMQTTAPAAEPAAAEVPAAEVPAPEKDSLVSDAFMKHMHAHAEQLDSVNFALADDDFDGAMTPAYWLSRHEDVSGIPADQQQYMDGMHATALAVENAPDLETARAAAEQITEQCQGCHLAAGVGSAE
jgi:cytochrome c556